MTAESQIPETSLWWSVRTTLADVVVPALEPGWARNVAIQLVGIADYARNRPADPLPRWSAEIVEILERLGTPLGDVDDDPQAVFARCGEVLAGAVGRDDAAADAVRRELRPRLVAYLDEELAATSVMMPTFRGSLPDA